MIKSLDGLVISAALIGTLLVPGCISDKSGSRCYKPQYTYSQQMPKKETGFEIRLKRIIEEERYNEPFDFIEENLISDAPRTEKEMINVRKKVEQIDLSAPSDNRERRIIEKFSKSEKPELRPIEKVFLEIYGLPYNAKSLIYLNRKASEIFSSQGFK